METATLLERLTACPACGATAFRTLYTAAPGTMAAQLDGILFSMLDVPYQSVHYDVCEDCGLLFLNPRWNGQALDLLYGEAGIYRRAALKRFRLRTGRPEASELDYFRYIDDTVDHPDRIHKGHEARGRWLLRRMASQGAAPKLADVGAGFGAAQKALQHLGFEYRGFESAAEMVNMAKGLGRSIECVPFSGLNASVTEPVDVVYTAQFMEHVNRPVECMQALRAILRPDGFLFVDVPSCQYFAFNLDSFLGTVGHRREYMNWGHMLQFDHVSLANTMLRSGFRPIARQYVGSNIWMVGRKLEEVPAQDGYLRPNLTAIELNVRFIDPLLQPVGDTYRRLRSTAKGLVGRLNHRGTTTGSQP